jgi:signal transduction protein with GAF and PtsI domain
LSPLPAARLQDFDTRAPRRPLVIIDLTQIENLPLHHASVRGAAILHNAPVTMLLAIFVALGAAQKHAAIVHTCLAGSKRVGLHYSRLLLYSC